jgi:hypothetical protein
MSEHEPTSAHERVARLLRDQGPVTAPPDLRSDVMEQVRAEPRPRHQRPAPWRPVLGVAAAAACLLALGFGVAHLGGGAGSSASSAGGGNAAAEAESGNTPTYTVAVGDARRILGPLPKYSAATESTGPVSGSDNVRLQLLSGRTYRVAVPSAVYRRLASRLARAAGRVHGRSTVVVILAHKR